MSCLRKNNAQKPIAIQVSLVFIQIVFFMMPPSVMASHRKDGAKKEGINSTSNIPEKVLYSDSELKKAFDRLDINSDGCLTIADYEPDRSKLALLAIIPCCREMIPAFVLESRKKWNAYAQLDINGDGQVDLNEFIASGTNPF